MKGRHIILVPILRKGKRKRKPVLQSVLAEEGSLGKDGERSTMYRDLRPSRDKL